MMAQPYTIGDKTIDLEKLVAIGEVQNDDLPYNSFYIPVWMDFNSNIVICFTDESAPSTKRDIYQSEKFKDELRKEVETLINVWAGVKK